MSNAQPHSAAPAAAAATAAAAPASAAAATAAAAPSASARKRQRHRAKGKGKAEAAAGSLSPQSASSSQSSHSSRGGHTHEHGGHGGGHSHSHDGAPCGGHGGDAGSGFDHARVPAEDMSEAVHYTDVLFHFNSYATHSFRRLERMHSDFQTMPSALQSLVPGFEARMGSLRKAIVANHEFLAEIVAHRYIFQTTDDIDYEALEDKADRSSVVDEERMSKVRSTLRQCVRDWSAEGAAERDACYGPILRELERLYPDRAARKHMRVLVPGSGLGRLVWEVAARGFFAQGNEFSYFMLLCSFLILNACKEKDIFTLYPFVHESKNLLDPADQLRAVKIPDVNPSVLPEGGQLSMVAGDWMDIFSDLPASYIHGGFKRKLEQQATRQKLHQANVQQWAADKKKAAAAGPVAAAAFAASSPRPEESAEPVPDPVRKPATTTGPLGEAESKPSNASTWDVFASCYFVDCANNILEFLRTIAYVLKPGGHWINFGPLLYHFSDVPREISVDLSWKELRSAAPMFGLELRREELYQPSAYTSDERSMLRSQYFCVSCTWQKTGIDRTTQPGVSASSQLLALPAAAAAVEPLSVAWQSHLAANEGWTALAINAQSPLSALLTVSGARCIKPAASTGSGLSVDVWQIPAGKLGAFLLQASKDDVSIGRLEIEGVEMIGLIRK